MAIVSVGNAGGAADDAAARKAAVVALVADADKRAGPHVAVAHHALAVAPLAHAPDSDAGLLAAHDQVWVVPRHSLCNCELCFKKLWLS